MPAPIRVAIAGVGNCASALLQGLSFYREHPDAPGLTHRRIGGYGVEDVEVVAAFDVDRRKVGQPLGRAAFSRPNCAREFATNLAAFDVEVLLGPVLDGVAPHMLEQAEERSFRLAPGEPVDVAAALKSTEAELLLCYLPVGSEQGVRHYAEACLEAGVGLVNCVPVFVASDPQLEARFRERGLPVVGDDIKSQVGATIVHRALAALMCRRGVELRQTYQLNVGGNTDFLNMSDPGRLESKRVSKTEAVQGELSEPLPEERIRIGPSDYVAWQGDQKVAYVRLEGSGFGGNPMSIEVRMSVEDSPNSGGVVVDALRYAKLALDRGVGGALIGPSAACMKHPPQPLTEAEVPDALAAFLQGAE